MTISGHVSKTYPRYRVFGPHMLKTSRRMLSMYQHQLTISLDLWWVSLWVNINWSTYV